MAGYKLSEVFRWVRYTLDGITYQVLQSLVFEDGEKIWEDIPVVEVSPEEYLARRFK